MTITPTAPHPAHYDHYDDYVEACEVADVPPIHENDWYAEWLDDQRLTDYERRLPEGQFL